jgi:hypothetical protein
MLPTCIKVFVAIPFLFLGAFYPSEIGHFGAGVLAFVSFFFK